MCTTSRQLHAVTPCPASTWALAAHAQAATTGRPVPGACDAYQSGYQRLLAAMIECPRGSKLLRLMYPA